MIGALPLNTFCAGCIEIHAAASSRSVSGDMSILNVPKVCTENRAEHHWGLMKQAWIPGMSVCRYIA